MRTGERPWWLRLDGLPPGSGPPFNADETESIRAAVRGKIRWLLVPVVLVFGGIATKRLDSALSIAADVLLIVWGVLLRTNTFGLADRTSTAQAWELRRHLRPEWQAKRSERLLSRQAEPKVQGALWIALGTFTAGLVILTIL
jgi:hypothetical protein